MGSFVDAIICWIRWAVLELVGLLMGALNAIQSGFILAANAALSILPEDPGSVEGYADSSVLGLLNYIFPLTMIVTEFGLIMGAWILYRTVAWILGMARVNI